MVVKAVNDVVEMPWFQVLLGLVIVAVGVNGVMNPGSWAVATLPVIGDLTAVLPNVVHQLLGGLFAVAGLTQVNMELGLY